MVSLREADYECARWMNCFGSCPWAVLGISNVYPSGSKARCCLVNKRLHIKADLSLGLTN
jgi:hypothetical protein